MPTAAKQVTINDLTEELGKIQGAIITDYRGMTVEQITRLRRLLRPAGGQYQVVKNTLLKIAMAKRELPDLGQVLEGPTAVLFAEGDPVEATKILTKFVKDLRKDIPQIKGGFLGQRVMSVEDVANLATLPSRDEILGNLVGTLQSPIANVVGTLGAVLSNLVGTIEAYHTAKNPDSQISDAAA
jgi:large subunit ribosomal protein L10